MITFEAVEIPEIPASDWIFFTSKNSVRFFFKSGANIGDRKVACVGRGTHKELARYVNDISFVGNAVDVQKVGQEFVRAVNGGICVFPVSNISKRTIQRYFTDKSKAIDLVVYKTEERKSFENPEADVLIFTSPSNARAYHAQYPILKRQKVIAMGPTTRQQLVDIGVLHVLTPKIPGELGLLDLI